MSDWKKTKIGDFLFERKGKYKPNDKLIAGLQRIEKIDFSGNFHIASKPSKTNMILIKKGDLVISGINVAKGAMGIYSEEGDVVATIHYSSYTFDKTKINVGYFKRFLKSAEFIRLIEEQIKGGIKTEIKPKHVLPLEILLPSLDEQELIVKHFESVETEDLLLNNEISNQQNLLKKLRQQILQDAIKGRLTKDWREQNPNVEPASELLKRIEAEKQQLIKDKKIKKQKALPAITEGDKPFELPESWEWCRLGGLINISSGDGLTSSNMKEGKIPVFGGNGITGYHDEPNTYKVTVTIGRVGAHCGAVHLTPELAWITDNCFKVWFSKENVDIEYLVLHLKQMKLGKSAFKGAQPVISGKRVYPLITQIPPLAEQKEIVKKVEKLFAICDQLEEQITSSQTNAEQLMQSVLKEAFSQDEKVD